MDKLRAMRRAAEGMERTGLAPASDLIAARAALEREEARAAFAASVAGATPRQVALDLRDLVARLPRDLAARPALATLAEGNRLRAAGVVLLLCALAGLLLLPQKI